MKNLGMAPEQNTEEENEDTDRAKAGVHANIQWVHNSIFECYVLLG